MEKDPKAGGALESYKQNPHPVDKLYRQVIAEKMKENEDGKDINILETLKVDGGGVEVASSIEEMKRLLDDEISNINRSRQLQNSFSVSTGGDGEKAKDDSAPGADGDKEKDMQIEVLDQPQIEKDSLVHSSEVDSSKAEGTACQSSDSHSEAEEEGAKEKKSSKSKKKKKHKHKKKKKHKSGKEKEKPSKDGVKSKKERKSDKAEKNSEASSIDVKPKTVSPSVKDKVAVPGDVTASKSRGAAHDSKTAEKHLRDRQKDSKETEDSACRSGAREEKNKLGRKRGRDHEPGRSISKSHEVPAKKAKRSQSHSRRSRSRSVSKHSGSQSSRTKTAALRTKSRSRSKSPKTKISSQKPKSRSRSRSPQVKTSTCKESSKAQSTSSKPKPKSHRSRSPGSKDRSHKVRSKSKSRSPRTRPSSHKAKSRSRSRSPLRKAESHKPKIRSRSPSPRKKAESHKAKSRSKSQSPRRKTESHKAKSRSRSRSPRKKAESHKAKSKSKSQSPRRKTESHKAKSRSRSRSPRKKAELHKAKSRSRSRSPRKKAESHKAKSRSRSRSPRKKIELHKAKSNSKSQSPRRKTESHKAKSRSRSRSPGKKAESHKAKSRSRSRSPRKKAELHKAKSRSRSRSPRKKAESHKTKSRSRSRSPRKKAESHKAKSRSRSRSPKSRTSLRKARNRSRSQSPRSKTESHKSRSRSPRSKASSDKHKSKSRSRSPKKKTASSKAKSKSRSPRSKPGPHKARSKSRSRSPRSKATSNKARSRSRSRTDSQPRAAVGRSKWSRSRSRSRGRETRPRKTRDVGEPRLKIDKAKLRRIAIANVLATMKTAGPEEPPPPPVKVATLKSGGKTVAELTDFCKKFTEGSDSDSDENGPRKPEDEEEDKPFIHHPFKLRDPQSSIVMNIRNARQLPTMTPQEKQSQLSTLRLQFPVDSGSHHRAKESEWVPVEKTTPGAAAVPAGGSNPESQVPGQAPPAAGQAVEAAAPGTDAAAGSVAPDKVFPDPPSKNIDITSIVSERLQAVRKLQENPQDVQALSKMHQAQQQASLWAQSKHLPGQFTGSTGVQVLTPQQLAGPDKRNQAWVKKDTFIRAAPVKSGIGMRLLQKMGWREGEGLGKHNEGTTEPLMLEFKLDRKGLTSDGEANKKPPAVPVIGDLSGKHPVSALTEFCNKRRWKAPQFELISESGPDHKKNFLFKVIVNNVEYQSTVASSNKKAAKAQAAAVCLQQFGLIAPGTPLVI